MAPSASPSACSTTSPTSCQFSRISGYARSPRAAASRLSSRAQRAALFDSRGRQAKHATYGVVAAHFPVVGAAFLKTLSVGLGDAYTDEVAAAFTGLWGVVEATMLAGAAEKEAADNSPGLVKEGSGNYVAAPTADGEADVKESMTKAVDWYSNPKAEARG